MATADRHAGRVRAKRGRGVGRSVPAVLATLAALAGVVLAGPAAVGQPDESLRLFPIPPVLAGGESIRVEAFLCPLEEGFGVDGVPSTDDDGCEVANKAKWSVDDPKVARVSPKQGPATELTARADGESTLIARFEASRSLSFESRVPVRVAAASDDATDGRPAGDAEAADDGEADAGAEPGGEPAEGPPGRSEDLPVAIVIHPVFAVLPPDSDQVFVAYVCPLPDERDPRGPDMLPGSEDDFCKPVVAEWSVLGDPPPGTVDPEQGIFTVLHTAGGEPDTAFLSSGARVAQSEGTLSGVVQARVGDQVGGASLGVAAEAPDVPPFTFGDLNGDGVVDLTDASHIMVAYGSLEGQPPYEAAADLNGDGDVDSVDLEIWLEYFDRS